MVAVEVQRLIVLMKVKVNLLVSASDEESSALLLDEDEGGNPSEEHLRPEKEASKGKQEESQSPPQDASPNEVNPEEALDSLPQERLLDAPEKEAITNGGGGGTANGGKGNPGQNTGLSPNNSDPTALIEPEVKQVLTPEPIKTEPSPAMTVSAEETNPTAPKVSQNARETTSKTSSSNAETAPEAPGKTSGNGEPNQNREDTDQRDSMNNATTSHPAETTATSISTSGSDGIQKKEDKVDNSVQRPNRKEPQDGLEDGNTDDAPTASETELQTPGTATTQKNATSKSGDSDGSTAVSHTTSPLLLFVVVLCAAAAAVMAA
ncbi:mucin-associated surface protein (MASP) [Trypanosoma cruzi]|nr:mucin-associated surface protein (MASP) [Trypanosoma cruzi]